MFFKECRCSRKHKNPSTHFMWWLELPKSIRCDTYSSKICVYCFNTGIFVIPLTEFYNEEI